MYSQPIAESTAAIRNILTHEIIDNSVHGTYIVHRTFYTQHVAAATWMFTSNNHVDYWPIAPNGVGNEKFLLMFIFRLGDQIEI